MATVNRTIKSDADKTMATKLIEKRPVPFVLTVTDGDNRSNAQNRTAHMWMKEISEQRGDMTPSEVRSYCKLTIGIPLLREENEAFRVRYDEILKPLSYEQKIDLMGEPFDLAVTRLMTTKQNTEYLERIIRHFSDQGIVLTMPEDHRFGPISNSGPSLSEPEEPADAAPSSAAAGSSPPGTASQPIGDETRGQMIAFTSAVVSVLKMTDAGEAFQIRKIGELEKDWLVIIDSPKSFVSKIAGYARAVVAGKDLHKFINYVAGDLLDCTPAAIGG